MTGIRRSRSLRVLGAACLLSALLAATARAQVPLLSPGTPFPSWTLVDQTGAKLSSKDLAGKRYLLWFFAAKTIGATTLADALRDRYDKFRAKGVEILGVSFSPPKDNAPMFESGHLPFRLLSDVDRELGLAVGVADRRKAPAPRRCSYLVNADGKVERVYCEVNFLTHADEVLGDL